MTWCWVLCRTIKRRDILERVCRGLGGILVELSGHLNVAQALLVGIKAVLIHHSTDLQDILTRGASYGLH